MLLIRGFLKNFSATVRSDTREYDIFKNREARVCSEGRLMDQMALREGFPG